MSKFTARNSYAGLEEAVNSILEDDEDNEYDFIIVPPDPGAITDEEEGEAEDLHICNIPNDIPGTLEVIWHAQSDWNDSDDKPLSSKRPRTNLAHASVPKWRQCPPSYSTNFPETNSVQSRRDLLVDNLKDLSPVQIFEKLFDDEVYELIVSNSLIYAGQNNRHSFELDKKDLRSFIGILILSGYHYLPRERQYWSLDEDLGVQIVTICMSKNRFLDIKKNIHFADNRFAELSNDKMYD